ncbi:Zinc finger protein 106 [Anthophora retusa]
MSSSGYRGRNFGPRGARSNGPTNGFNGPRFLHPSFNHPRPPHRLPGSEKWIERPNFVPWQQSKNFLHHPQYRGNLQFRPNNRGRAAGGRGIVRYSGPGRPPASQFCMGFIRNPISRAPLHQEEQVEIKSTLVPQTLLPGSEEERQQKISETADKLKQKLSSITEEEITNFWEDDLSVLPNNGSEDENTLNKGIPELRHEPPELDLTFSDFRDIGRVNCSNSKLENVDNKSNDESQISFEQKPTDSSTSTNDEITIIYENKDESLINLDLTLDKDNLDPSVILLDDDKCPEQTYKELPNFECNVEALQLHSDDITENIISSNLNDASEKSLTLNLNENVANSASIESVDDLKTEKSLVVSNIEASSILIPTADTQNALQVDFSQDQIIVQTGVQNTIRNITQDANVDAQHNDYAEASLHEDNQCQNNSQINDSQEMVCPNLANISDSSQHRSFNIPSSNEEIHSNNVCDSISPAYLNYSEIHKLSDDKKLNNSPVFQSRVFTIPPRFTPRIAGLRCRWTFQQNGKNLFFRGPQRLAFHGNRMSPSRHITPVPVGFDPRAPPPFTHNVPVSSHDSQHNTLVPFSSIDLPPAFDPSEPPPNIRSKSATEPCNRQENTQTAPSLETRSQVVNNSQSNIQIMQPPPAFDPRGPPPRIPNVTTSEKLPEFNPQQPPPKIHKRDETLQPPPIFDPRLSSQERSNLISPLNSSRSNMMSMNLMEASQVSEFNIGPVAPNFSQLPPMNIPSHQSFISNVHMNFQPVLPQANSGQPIMSEFALPPPPISVTKVPPPPPKEFSAESNSNLNQSINMDDGLEDMQEAMEFAKQIMNMSEEIKNENVSSMLSELPPSEIPVPNETVPHSSLIEEIPIITTKKQRRKENKNKRSKQNIVCGPEFILERQEEIATIDEEQSVQNQNKNTEDTLLSNDQIRPKVVFNLNSKTKKIQKPDEWHRIPLNIPENREISQQGAIQNSNKEKTQSKKHSCESKKSNINQNKNQQKESSVKMNSVLSAPVISTSMHEKSNDASCHKDYSRDLEKPLPHSSNTIVSNNTNTQKNQKTKKDSRKVEAPSSESSWKNRVINRFLKMSKNDICNMVNNSSLRKFDIAMKHLVKERRTSLSLEMRNTEDEKMKEYDREEFMSQLNAMLDPSAVVGITDLPTEFIHHLSEVLQLDPMPFDAELSENQSTGIDEVTAKIILNQDENSRIHIYDFSNEENEKVQSFTEYSGPRSICEEHVEDKLLYKEDLIRYPLTAELNLNISREDTNLSQRSLSNKMNPEIENTHKKQQQPLFNEADLDDILSEVTERTKNLPNAVSSLELEKSVETRTSSSLPQTVTEAFEYNTFSQIPNKTAADLDDIFSAGIARVKLLGKSNAVDSDNLRARKSSSEDRNTFRPEKYERWNRKEREDPDAFRNLTKEEWEAKYGSTTNITTTPIITRKSASNSVENLSRDNRSLHTQRYCSSDSPMRHLSISPLTRESSVHNVDRCTTSRSNEIEEIQRVERSESSTDSSSSSSSDSDEETSVAPNVTKLLKVIKEKEKIAKKKSLNETIRDEVTAEIEKKWKEKSKNKERKFRKREKRKRDKRDKRKKEKKKRKKRNSHSDSSKSSEQIEEGFRLLTENEIKKEVIVKEEPVNSLEESVSFNSGASNTYVVPTLVNNKTVDLRIESQCSNIEVDQVPAVTCDTVLSQIKIKPPVIVTTMQPKTKAQLKQMPESTEIEQRQTIEKSAEIVKDNGIMNTNNERMKDFLEIDKDDKTANSSNEQVNTISSINISLHQTDIPLNIREPFSSIQSLIGTVSDNRTMHLTSFSNLGAEVNTSTKSTDQKPLQITIKASSMENKSGSYKKIDIKAYKERALQRRLKEQSMLKENPEDLASLTRDLHLALPVASENIVEPLNTLDDLKITEIDTNKIPLKDPRVARRSSSAHAFVDSNKEVKERSNSEGDYQSMDIVKKAKEPSIVVQLKNVNKKGVTQLVDSDLNTLKDFVKCKERKSDGKSLRQEIAIESSKFKNIRSEGSKELKLKKERAKKLMEKKKKKSYDPLIVEKHIEKYSHRKVSEDNQESLVVQVETEKTNSREVHEDLSRIVSSDMCSNSKLNINDRSIQKQINAHSSLELNKQDSNETILNKQQVVDKDRTQNKDNLNFVNSENGENSIKQTEKDTIRIVQMETSSELISIGDLNKKKDVDVCKDMSMGLTSLPFTQSISTEKCIENTVSLITDYVSEESRSLSGRTTDVDVRNLTNVESVKDAAMHDNYTLAMEMDSGNDSEGNNINVEADNVQAEDKSKIKIKSHGDLKDADIKIRNNETKFPESPNSPFKGFLADSNENDICQVSDLYKVKVSFVSGKEIAKNNPKQWLQTCFNDKLSLEFVQDDKNIDERKDESNETKSICRLMEDQQGITVSNVANETKDNTLHLIDNIEATTVSATANGDITGENDQTYNAFSEQRNASPVIDINSRNSTIFDDGEPFIVLDEYIDDADGKSMEKLNALDLDFEDCIARDADIFTNKTSPEEESRTKTPNFNSIDFKELSEVLDKENMNKEQNQSTVTGTNENEETVLPEKKLFASEEGSINAMDIVSSTSESNSESSSKITKIDKLIHSTVLEVPIESSQNLINTTSKDIAQKSLTPELSYTDTGRTEEENLHCPYISKSNSQPNSESSSATKMGITSLEAETSPNSSVPIETATTKSSLENSSVVKSIENEEEFLELNKQMYDRDQSNLQGLNGITMDKLNVIPSETGMFSDKDVFLDSIIGQETSKDLNKTTLNKANQKKVDEMLHEIKNKSRMKHKKQKHNLSKKAVKKVMKSDTVKVKYPSTKEAIMARMIEIDVEIHKLMTEKMTLYQILTNDALPSDNNLQQNNITHEEKEIETPVIRPRTPSALMSQLIQKIETSPVTNQCAKITTENVSTKDSTINSVQPNKSKILSRNEHHIEKKGSCTSTCGSDDEESMHHAKSFVSRKRKRQRSERLPKRLESKSDSSVSSKDAQITEKHQVNDATKITSRKINTRQTIVEQDSSQVSINENKSQEDKIFMQQIDKEDFSSNDKTEMVKIQKIERTVECAKSQTSAEEIIQEKVTELNEEICLTKDIEVKTDTSKECANSAAKSQENKTPERSSIYSDDSTWDSLLQNSSIDDQKKPNTGLALLEETYKKEMAKTRKIKAEARKKKKKKLHNLLQAVNSLTPEEEELPLSALYIKKLHQRRKLLHSLEYQAKQQVNNEPGLWKNVVEVINAVAENRTEELHVEQLHGQLIGDADGSTSDIEKSSESKQTVDSLTLENTKDACIEPSVDIKTCENEGTTNSESQKDNVQLLSSKSQECLSNEYFQKDLEVSVSSKITEDLPGISTRDTSTNFRENLAEISAQQNVENSNAEMNQLNLIDDTDLCCMEVGLSNLNTSENLPTRNLKEDKIELENREPNLQERISNVEEDISVQESINSQSMTPDTVEKCQDDSTGYNNDRNTSITSEMSMKEGFDFEIGGINEERLKDSTVLCEKDSNEDDSKEKSNCTPLGEQFISLKEHKELQRRKESERFNKDPSEENNNQNGASISSTSESAETLKSEETCSKKSSKRKRTSSRTPLRRSSRYIEESTKRIKLEVDGSIQNTEQESQEKNLKMQFPSISTISLSSCEDEIETILINPRKSRGTQKVTSNRKRYTPMPLDIEILYESNSNNEPLKGIKRYKQRTISEMMNCVVKLADCKDTILNPNKSPTMLQKYGTSGIVKCSCPNSTQLDPFVSSVQSTSTKDLSGVCTKETASLAEFPPNQTTKLFKKFEETTRPVNDQTILTKVNKRTLKPGRIDSLDKEDHADPDIEVMPVLIKEPVAVDYSQNYEKPDIEIVEEKMIVTKSQHNNSGSTLTVIDTKDDKEVPRTQYTVHKGPILDIKIFENSFLAASEDGRVYRYNQASNGILNIYKGHKAAVTCLYVHNANSTDVNKEWVFSGSLDGTLRCYNIMTGVQARETADIGSPIQCMDEAWGIIFIGTKSGHVSRYHMKSGVVKGNSIQFSDKSVLALKATNEGPRRVLIVASRSQPITIRDAQSGLFLRTICGQKNHTVYSLMRDHNLIYCGTSSTSIPVFDFTNGEQTMQYDAGVGIVCMRLYRQLLFAGCYDGNIYVFDTKDHRLVCSIPGPGNMLLSMEVIDNKIIAGSKDKRLQSWQMPRQVRTLL